MIYLSHKISKVYFLIFQEKIKALIKKIIALNRAQSIFKSAAIFKLSSFSQSVVHNIFSNIFFKTIFYNFIYYPNLNENEEKVKDG